MRTIVRSIAALALTAGLVVACVRRGHVHAGANARRSLRLAATPTPAPTDPHRHPDPDAHGRPVRRADGPGLRHRDRDALADEPRHDHP